jgi:hypothetical protein
MIRWRLVNKTDKRLTIRNCDDKTMATHQSRQSARFRLDTQAGSMMDERVANHAEIENKRSLCAGRNCRDMHRQNRGTP